MLVSRATLAFSARSDGCTDCRLSMAWFSACSAAFCASSTATLQRRSASACNIIMNLACHMSTGYPPARHATHSCSRPVVVRTCPCVPFATSSTGSIPSNSTSLEAEYSSLDITFNTARLLYTLLDTVYTAAQFSVFTQAYVHSGMCLCASPQTKSQWIANSLR